MAWFHDEFQKFEPQYEANELVRRAKAQEEFGRFTVAEDLLKMALQIRKQELAGSEFGVLDDLGHLYVRMERFAEAVPLFIEAVELIEKEYYRDHPLTAHVLDHWALAMILQNKWEQAETLVERSFAIKQKSLLMQDVDTLETMRTLAAIKRNLAKFDQANNLLTKAIGLVGPATIGPVEEFFYEQALVYQQQGKIIEAEKVFDEALAIFAHRAGKNRRFAACLIDYSQLLKEIGKQSDARRLASEAQAILAETDTKPTVQNTPGPLYFERGLYAATILH